LPGSKRRNKKDFILKNSVAVSCWASRPGVRNGLERKATAPVVSHFAFFPFIETAAFVGVSANYYHFDIKVNNFSSIYFVVFFILKYNYCWRGRQQ
jgi:hypothetical protein